MTDDPSREPARTPASPPRPASAPPEQRAAWFRMTEASSVGIEMVVAITVCSLGGYYIERYLTHWSPWTMLIGVALGCMTAANAVIRTAKTYQRSLRASAAEAATRPDPAAPPERPARRDDDGHST